MSRYSGRALGEKLCEMLGLDPNHVFSIQLTCSVDEAATVTVQHYVTDAEALETGLPLALKQYELVEKIDSTVAPADVGHNAVHQRLVRGPGVTVSELVFDPNCPRCLAQRDRKEG